MISYEMFEIYITLAIIETTISVRRKQWRTCYNNKACDNYKLCTGDQNASCSLTITIPAVTFNAFTYRPYRTSKSTGESKNLPSAI